MRGNSTLLASSTGGAAAAAAAAPATTAGPGKALVAGAAAAAQATCPATIGWNKDYSHPVTLTETPRADRTVATGTYAAAATTTLAKPAGLTTEAAGVDLDALALKKDVKSGGGSKCGAKKMRKRHSDNGLVSSWKKAKRARSL